LLRVSTCKSSNDYYSIYDCSSWHSWCFTKYSSTLLFNFLAGKECEVFAALFDIDLKATDDDQGDQTEKTKVVIPDLSVICDKTKLSENKYVGSPELIIEIISPSNQAHDLVKKLNLYMQCGVKEYWIVNPLLNTVQIYVLYEEGQYHQVEV